MSSLGLIISIAVPVLLILILVVMLSRLQQKKQAQRGQARAVKIFIEDLADALEFLVKVDNKKEIQNIVLERIKQLNRRYIEILSTKAKTADSAIDIESLAQLVSAGGKKKTVLKSDQEIRYAKKQFSTILKSFGPMVRNRTASEATILEFKRYLRISILEMEVNSFTAQGDVAAQRGDVTTASGYYKAARRILIDFKMQYPEKNELIKSLSDKTAALFNGGVLKEGSLAKELSKEKDDERDENGFTVDPNSNDKQNF